VLICCKFTVHFSPVQGLAPCLPYVPLNVACGIHRMSSLMKALEIGFKHFCATIYLSRRAIGFDKSIYTQKMAPK